MQGAQVLLWLADFAQVQGEKMTSVGAGVTVRDPEPQPMFLAGIIRLPRDVVGTTIQLRIELHSLPDGQRMPIKTAEGSEAEALFGVLEPTGLRDPGLETPFELALGIGVPPFGLEPSRAYRWQAYLDGETQPDWNVRFRTTPPEPLAG